MAFFVATTLFDIFVNTVFMCGVCRVCVPRKCASGVHRKTDRARCADCACADLETADSAFEFPAPARTRLVLSLSAQWGADVWSKHKGREVLLILSLVLFYICPKA